MKSENLKYNVGIIGGAGYTAGELLRILINHPDVEIKFVYSESNAGKKIHEVHESMVGETDMIFSDCHPLEEIDILFLCSAHGASKQFWNDNTRPEKLKVIDLAQDFRDESNGYVYGLPEVNRERIASTDTLANPGCFATAIQLSLLPLAAKGLLRDNEDINVTAITGSTGAGVMPGPTKHFSWRIDNLSVYKPFTHQHLKEITRTLKQVQPGFNANISFIPVRGDFARGIFSITTLKTDLSQEEVTNLFKNYYKDSPFVVVSDTPINLKQVINTNKAVINVLVENNRLLITCAEDNLLKGASGQAVENMNIMLGLPQDRGLRLKPSTF